LYSSNIDSTGSTIADEQQQQQQRSLYEPSQYCEHVYRTEIEQLQYTSAMTAVMEEPLPTIHVIDINNIATNTSKNETLTASAIPYTSIDTELQLRTVTEQIVRDQINTIAFDLEAH
jgi:hypothetical protein